MQTESGQSPDRRVIPFPGTNPEGDRKPHRGMSSRQAEALLLDRVSAGSAVFVGTAERKGKRYQCYRLFNGEGQQGEADSTLVYQLHR